MSLIRPVFAKEEPVDFGHGFIPRIDARNYKAVERCLPRSGPSLFQEDVELPWVIHEGPWATVQGKATIELCRFRGTKFMVDTQAWRYRDARTFSMKKFIEVPHAPAGPIFTVDKSELRDFVRADLALQASLGASAYLLPGVVPHGPKDAFREQALTLLAIAESNLPHEPRPCIAFIGAHSSSLEGAHELIDQLPHWIDGVYIQLTPLNPLTDSPSKIIDNLMLLGHASARGFSVVSGRQAALAPLLRIVGVSGMDAGLAEGESFEYNSKFKNFAPRPGANTKGLPLSGRLYVPQLGRSLSSQEWTRLMQVPALRGQLLCQLPCCNYGQSIEQTPHRGREHALQCRITEAKSLSHQGLSAASRAIAILEARLSFARTVEASLRDAKQEPIGTTFIENHLAVARFVRNSMSDAA